MNEAMKREHYKVITDLQARRVYARLCDACDQREGGMTDPDQMLILAVAEQEQIAQMLMEDIKKRGIGEEKRNGRQSYWADNKSIPQLRACREQQRKHMNELRITPAGRKAAPVEIEDDFDRFG